MFDFIRALTQMLELSQDLKDKIVSWRRSLHAIPEKGFCETETAKFVSNVLESLGYSVTSGVARTGVVAELGSGKTVVLRAEMDGYPIAEELTHSFSSKVEGMMHACGHDANMACILGAAELLKDKVSSGRVRILMQPSAEAISPEDQMSGSNKSISEGVLKDAEALVSLHVDSTIRSGSFGILNNKIDNRIETFNISIKNQSEGNAMHSGGKLIDALYSGAGKNDTYKNLFKIESLNAENLNAPQEEAMLCGSFESMGRDTFSFFDQLLAKCCEAEQANGCSVVFSYDSPNPDSYSSDLAIEAALAATSELAGQDSVKQVSRKAWSDDFFPFSSRVSSALILLGVGASSHPQILHTSTFDVDESQLSLGSLVVANTVLNLLN